VLVSKFNGAVSWGQVLDGIGRDRLGESTQREKEERGGNLHFGKDSGSLRFLYQFEDSMCWVLSDGL
jgi:hypothetical protein